MPFTRRISMLAVAVAGTTLLALSPTRALAIPRTLSEGKLISSTSFLPSLNPGAGHTAHVERRQIDQFHQFSAAAFGPAKRQCPHQLAVDFRGFRDGALFSIDRKLDPIVEVVDQHAAVIVLHGREQPRQRHRRVGRPIPVMPAVQFVTGPVESDIELRDAARAEDDLRAAALMYRAVADRSEE